MTHTALGAGHPLLSTLHDLAEWWCMILIRPLADYARPLFVSVDEWRDGFLIKPRSHLLPCLEVGHSFLSDRNDSASSRIAPRTCFAELNREGSETPKFDSISPTQRFDHRVEYRVDDLLNVALEKVRVLRGNALYELRFYHGLSLQIGATLVKRPAAPELTS
jgi:hypothetical protein